MQKNGLSKTLIAICFSVIALFVVVSTVRAATLLSQAYVASEQLPTGSIVSLQKGSTAQVDAATIDNSKYLLGVIIQSDIV